MNIIKTRKLAEVLILSAVRARRGSTSSTEKVGGLRNNRVFIYGFPVLAAATYLFLSRVGVPKDIISAGLSQAFVFIPFLSMFLMVMNGLMFEVTLSQFNTSTDIINWLPIQPSEYVVASTVSSTYFSLPFLMFIYGVPLGASIFTGQAAIWLVSTLVSLMSMLIGGFLIEIVRAFLNEASSAISERGGRLAQALQLISTVLIIAVMALLFNYNVLLRIMEWFGITLDYIWFIPLFWPSMFIQTIVERRTTMSFLYGAGTLLLLGVSFLLGSYARRRYWVPKPITLSIGSSGDSGGPRFGSLKGRPEQVIAVKDFKALTRRREMMTLLAIPLMLFLVNFIQMDVSLLWDEGASYTSRLGVFMLPGMGLYMMSVYVGMISIGQEGKGFINLQMSPLKSREIILGKAAVGWLISGAILAFMLALEMYFIGIPVDAFFAIAVAGFSTVTVASFMGVMFGTVYPDFSEVPRARFISPEGSLVSLITTSMVVLATISPSFINHYIYGNGLSYWLTGVITLALTFVVSAMCIRYSQEKLRELLLSN